MPSLREVQTAVAAGVFGDAAVPDHIISQRFSGARHLQIYRNNTFTSLTEALRAVYPVITRLVGEEFFRHAAHEYIRRYPSTSGNLHEFGHEFAGFIAGFPSASALVYLPDVTRLEWAYHQVFHAAEHAPLALNALATVPQEKYAELKFKLHPACRLLASEYPIFRIWQVNQPDYTGDNTVDLSLGGSRLLIIRHHLTVEIEPLSAGEYALLRSLASGHNFARACEAALAAEARFDLNGCLPKHVMAATLVGFLL
ncbi:MAG TPA: DNA-binding domain-containing protein [Acidiferrobacterales bacterium]|nr:DNA-binding domain-containing protein [Acidiferrobacterales bacterium]